MCPLVGRVERRSIIGLSLELGLIGSGGGGSGAMMKD